MICDLACVFGVKQVARSTGRAVSSSGWALTPSGWYATAFRAITPILARCRALSPGNCRAEQRPRVVVRSPLFLPAGMALQIGTPGVPHAVPRKEGQFFDVRKTFPGDPLVLARFLPSLRRLKVVAEPFPSLM